MVSNPVCSPRFRTSASVLVQKAAFATDVPPHIFAFHRYMWYSAFLFHTLARQYRMAFPGRAQGFHTRLIEPPTRALRPVIPINACTLCITAAAGTELAGASSLGNVKTGCYSQPAFLPYRKCFTSRRPSSHTRHCWIRVSPIVQDSPLLPPVGVWAVSQSQCGCLFSLFCFGSLFWLVVSFFSCFF